MATRKIFNAQTQQTEDAELVVDKNHEIVATFKDGSILKFPAGLTKEEFEGLIKVHGEVNAGLEVITPEVEAREKALRENSLALIGEPEEVEGVGPTAPTADEVPEGEVVQVKVKGDTTPEGEQSNADSPSTEDKPD